MDVALIRWPEEAARLPELREGGQPRLLLVAAEEPPPETDTCFEDWIRLPAADADVLARIRSLEQRLAQHQATLDHRDTPSLDENGVLRRGDAWVALPPVEARLFAALLDRFGRVTTRQDLNRAGWPAEEPPDRNVLDVHILHLRRKTAPLGLSITTIRSRGYLLEAAASAASASNGDRATA